ncbi:MAG: hypothetical protein I8H98_09720 [Moraxellaceae bacterium]|uniref:Uncharacterized protein n=1 Tax=Acinetobacter tjernbergiae DSM 14971 = CIP 107465 TaxID=1120928 RepID=V2UJD5_9GAMM|nr:hypothetical protein [Acinetobacter tjernbergiae]ESK54803.1 hypothetical protein F990_02420 [Acinetobacter tjernbergiae DSM 14971 = CIP 107465]MBH2002525.1 hypothetical protein [Moraxellaceae bacterium]MBH2029637.1 hypothetical protein [Moraxellaceae bacterium]
MFDSKKVIVLDQMLILTKEGKRDLVYQNDTLLKVMMVSNQHMVVTDDHQTSFLLKRQDENVVWSFI